MAKKAPGIMLYYEIRSALEHLSFDEKGQLLDAMLNYGEYGEALKIKVAAPAIDGKANEELVRFIAKKLGLPRCGVRIVSGQTSRDKIVEVDAEDARARLLM